MKSRLGPGLVVAAAFIGPGTVTTATVAGARFGYVLLWTLLFSILATIVLQEMSARLGIVSRKGLGEALRGSFGSGMMRVVVIGLVLCAIGFGNAAFQTGNLLGAAMGLEVVTGLPRPMWVGVVGAVALGLLFFGTYKLIARALTALVAMMGLVFVVTAVMSRPDFGALLRGLLVPSLPPESIITCIALIGTTVVPYNLFLHAGLVREKWTEDVPTAQALRESRADTILAVSLGGVITLAVMATAASFFVRGTAVESAAAMAGQLEPLLGRWAKSFFALGLMAAGLTSAVTAPLAASFAAAGVLGWKVDLRSTRFRLVWAVVLVVGMFFALIGDSSFRAMIGDSSLVSMIGSSHVDVIILAQAANGIILPVIAVFLIVAVNRKAVLGQYSNGWIANSLGGLVVAIAAGLGSFQLWKVYQKLFL